MQPSQLLSKEQIQELLALNGVNVHENTVKRWLDEDRLLCPQQVVSHKVRRYRPAHVAGFIKSRTGNPAQFDKLGQPKAV